LIHDFQTFQGLESIGLSPSSLEGEKRKSDPEDHVMFNFHL
jgi:hypothetical protein